MDIVIIGHTCLDHFHDPVATRLGGTTLYGGLTAAHLGKKVGLITPLSPNLSPNFLNMLQHLNISLHAIETKVQTEFTHELRGDTRQLALEKKSVNIEGTDIPESFFNTKTCLLGAICNEIQLSVVESYAKHEVPLALELQGFVRKVLKNGRVELKKAWQEAPKFLKHVKYVKGAVDEGIACLGLSPKTELLEVAREISRLGPEIVVLTSGRKGAHIFKQNFFIHVPPISLNCVDRTGAGDSLFTAFLLHSMETNDEDILASGLFAAAAASFIIEDYGATRFGSREEIKKRLHDYLQK